MNYRSIIIVIILSTILACSDTTSDKIITEETAAVITNPEYGEWQTMEDPPVEFEVVQTFGADQEPLEATLSHVTDVFTDDSLNVYILDHESNKLVSFTPDGEFRWASGKKGKGPGDLENARSMTWDGEELIYIGNIYGSRIDRFNLQGTFLETLSVPENLETSMFGNKIVGFMAGKLVLFSGLDAEFAGNFYITEPGDFLQLVNSYTINLTGDVKVPLGMHEFSLPSIYSDQIIIPDVKNYSFHIYEESFKNQNIVNREFDWIVRPGFYIDGEDRMMGTFSAVNKVLKFGSGYYISSAYWVKGIQDPDRLLSDYINGKIEGMEYQSTIDLFNEDWELLYSLEADRNINPDFGQPIHIDREGNLYAYSFDPYPHLKKIKVIFEQ
ncbi:MAG: hypothetical protein WD059_05085 [Balneolaceae bacterium]